MLLTTAAAPLRLSMVMPVPEASPEPAPETVPEAGSPMIDFMDRSIRRERRLEALLRRAARGAADEEAREGLLFEAFENREHARILRRHRLDLVRDLRPAPPAPGGRVAKVGTTVTPGAALREAMRLRRSAEDEYRAILPAVGDRFLRKFLEVVATAQAEGVERLRGMAAGPFYSTKRTPTPDRAQGPVGSTLSAVAAAAS